MMKHKLEMPLEQFAEAVAKENERLISGPGGIMEMKQTIADKEKHIYYLEAILRDIQLYSMDPWAQEQASQAKVPLNWTENYGQGSEPWLNKE
jgi:hypothetical protein